MASLYPSSVDQAAWLDSADRLFRYIVDRHWNGEEVLGPDPGIRFNYRFGRFIKSSLGDLGWNDNYRYQQAQGYWIMANAALFNLTGEERHGAMIRACANGVLNCQQNEGCWPYPNPEWRGRIATVEGNWAAIGLLTAFEQTGDQQYLEGALRWRRYLEETIGYTQVGDTLSANYFAHDSRSIRVPNISATTFRLLLELRRFTGDPSQYQREIDGLLGFLEAVQLQSGELPYWVASPGKGEDRIHFQCFQYNAFQCLSLARAYQLAPQPRLANLIRPIAGFVNAGIRSDGSIAYACGSRSRHVVYHAAAGAAALLVSGPLVDDVYRDNAVRALGYVIDRQQADGGFPYSFRDYGMFRDTRSYPRYLAMILVHLLMAASPEL